MRLGLAPRTLEHLVARAPAEVAAVLAQRVRALAGALGTSVGGDLFADLAGVAPAVAAGGEAATWLALTVLGAAYPDTRQVQRTLRAAALDGPLAALDAGCLRPLLTGDGARNAAGRLPRVRVVGPEAVVVDVNDTSRSLFATGIQRVARETVRRWDAQHPLALVGWDGTLPALRLLSEQERSCALHGADSSPPRPPADEVVVPWRTTYLLPELLAEPDRLPAFHTMLQYSGNRTGVVGFDCVPLTTAETVQSPEVSNGFARNLAAVARVTTLAPISAAAATEYGGWRAMLSGAGLAGPRIQSVVLPAEAMPATDAALVRARQKLAIAGLPLVLVVGSHEPRKNHLAVLHAAEILWRDGVQFSLLFVGGNAWGSEAFVRRVKTLAAAGRPVHTLSAASDEMLGAAYRIARCTVFASINEGFGLPLAESLAAGTPAVTSAYGSMAEIAADGGALLVDPRDVRSIAGAVRRLLTDDALHLALTTAALSRPARTWDDYAAELWQTLAAT